MVREAVAAALAALATGCAQEPQVPPAPPPPQLTPAACDEAAAQFAVGQVASAALAEQVRQRAGAQRVRTVRPGDMITMEFDPGRLNLELDAAGKVARVRCG